MRLIRVIDRIGRICGAILAAAIVASVGVPNATAEDLKIRSPIIEAGEVEFEHNFVFGRGKTTVHEIEYGLTDWFKPGIEVEFAADPGQGLHYDAAALEGFQWLARTEGILPALESAHAAAWTRGAIEDLEPGSIVLVNLSGRGDKDVDTVRQRLGPGAGDKSQ